MIQITEIIRRHLGWCPNARTIRTTPAIIPTPPVTLHPDQPDGGAGGSGRINRGIKLATGSIIILVRNRQLLWFSFLTGLVMIFSLVTSMYIQFISGTPLFPGTDLMTGPASALIARGSLSWIALTFSTGLISTALTYYLLAALIASVSLILSGRAATIRDGLAQAGNCRWPLVSWVVIGTLVGTALSVFMDPSTTTGGATGKIGLIFAAMAVLAVFYLLTLFVIPLLVLGRESLGDAVMDSVSLFRKVWGEILVCFILFFLIVFAVLLTSLVPMIAIAFPTGSTAAAGAVVIAYMLVMIVLLFVGSTILGIAVAGLYSYGKTGIMPAMFERKQDGVEHP
jgi:hypothetical protein